MNADPVENNQNIGLKVLVMSEFKVLFCCMGNICRSPMAEGLFRKLVAEAGIGDRVVIDSAGTHADFPDAPPDPRAQKLMAERGIDISGLRARRIARADFERFDLIVVMDGQNMDTLRFVCPRTQSHKISRLLDFAPQSKIRDVPDPFRGDESRFQRVLELVEAAGQGLLAHVRQVLAARSSI
jgi:protein-tyrosine phosphatase